MLHYFLIQVGNQTLAGLGVLLRLRGPQLTREDAQFLVTAGQRKGPIGGFNCDVFPTVCLFIRDIGATVLANGELRCGGSSSSTLCTMACL
jgi:hypothetical protein